MEIGNVITVILAAIGVVVVLALTGRWGQRLPWWTLVIPAAVATGALAPIALGLPIGALLQALLQGSVRSGGEGNLTSWVFALVYGGFAVFGITLAVLFAGPPRQRWARVLTVTAFILFAGAMLFWAFVSEPMGLAGWKSIAQRAVLVVVALLSLLGCAALLPPGDRPGHRLRWTLGWIGCCTAAVQGPVMLLLANDAAINPVLLAVTLVATPGAAWLGHSAIHRTACAVSASNAR
ncbi:hypothetical protein AB0H57_30355 [Micromonospora sp. NPDC050686]|uniref:hypothetical protein n=1 Tax=Micromonospora sp. NPDC050686 TaxID=3154631 RepID=UPI0033F069FC